MLVKILSQKSILFQFFFGILFFALLFASIYPVNQDWYSVLAILSLILSAVVALVFYNNSNLINSSGYGLWFFLIWIICFSGITTDVKLSVSFLICNLIFWRWQSVNPQFGSKAVIFESSFLLIISALLYPPSVFLIVFIIFSYLYTQSFGFRGVILLFVGLILPLIIGIQLAYITDRLNGIEEYAHAFYLNFLNVPVWSLIPVGVLIVISLVDHIMNYAAQNTGKRQRYFLTFIYFVNWLVLLILFGGENINLFIFMGLPVSVFLSRFLQYMKSDLKMEIWLWIYAAFMAVFYFRNEIGQIYNQLLGNVSFQL